MRRIVFASAMSLVVIALCGLGVWQVARLSWKEALIAQVNARVHAPAVTAPGPGRLERHFGWRPPIVTSRCAGIF